MKNRILQELKENNGEYISGAELSKGLGVSRTAVWKCIAALRDEGYTIKAAPRKGYSLAGIYDILNISELTFGLKTKRLGQEIHCLDTVDSTNNYAKKLAYEGCIDGTVVTANTQTSGRGRLGREWQSPDGSGVWMSVVLRPSMPPEQAQGITLAASVAVTKAIKNVTGAEAGIKWPNDILLDGRKVCGILTEMSSEIDKINFVIIGIGINVIQGNDAFRGELEDKAISLASYIEKRLDTPDGLLQMRRSDLIKEILFQLEQVFNSAGDMDSARVVEEWKKSSVTLGKEIRVISRNNEYKGIAEDVTADGRLIVRSSDGSTSQILSGEVSIRGVMGY